MRKADAPGKKPYLMKNWKYSVLKKRAYEEQYDNNRQVEQKPPRGREYNNLPFKMHCDSINNA